MLLWEQHCCLPLSREAKIAELTRYARPGGAYVSVNIASGPTTYADALDVVRYLRAEVAAHPDLALAPTLAEVDAAARDSRVVVAFDLEDSSPLEGDLDRVREFYDLGVRTMLPTYNRRNAAGGGCLDETDQGLTAYGHALVAVMNEVGMVVDGSHCGERTGLDLSAAGARPMVYGHVCLRALHPFPRNITDAQALACAETGGVIGVGGIRHMIGTTGPLLAGMMTHVRYLLDLVGPAHVGLATDYVFDQAGLFAGIAANPQLYPETVPPRGPGSYLAPEEFLRAEDALDGLGLAESEVRGILGGNFRRVAQANWRA